MVKIKKIIFIAIIVILIVSSCTGNFVKEDKKYKIGSVLPLTGEGSYLGKSVAKGMQIAVDEINTDGGINNKKLELFIEDGKLIGKESVTATQYLLNTADPDIFTGFYLFIAISMSPVLKDAKKPFVYEAFSREILADNPYAFKANFDSESGCEELAKYMKENKKYNKLGGLFAKTSYNEQCLTGVKKIEPDFKVYWYNFGETDFRTLLKKAQSDGIDRLMVQGFESEFINMFKQLSEGDYKINIAGATTSELITQKVIDSSSEKELTDTISIDFIPLGIENTEIGKKCIENKAENVAYCVVGYEQVMYISKAMENCEPGDEECLSESLKNVKDYKTVIGTEGFKERVLQMTNKIYIYKNGWQLAS